MTGGPLNPHDVIRLNGVEAAQQYLVDEVQRVYRSQGVEIADKHVEVIASRMINRIRITDSGDTDLVAGLTVSIREFASRNKPVILEGKVPASGYPIIFLRKLYSKKKTLRIS